MSKAEKIIEKINNADEVEIMEFDFDDCFTYMREMERCLGRVLEHHNRSEVDYETMRYVEKLLTK